MLCGPCLKRLRDSEWFRQLLDGPDNNLEAAITFRNPGRRFQRDNVAGRIPAWRKHTYTTFPGLVPAGYSETTVPSVAIHLATQATWYASTDDNNESINCYSLTRIPVQFTFTES